MGIGGTLLSKIGLPIALIAGAGFLLFTFRKPILEAVSGGAQTLGSVISSPFGAILEGVKQGFSNIPEVIPITFPRFEFGFAQGQDPGGSSPNVPAINEEGFDFDQALTNLCRNSGGILCFQEKQQMDNANEVIKQTLTPFNIGRSFDVGTKFDTRGRETREQILKINPQAIGLFDDPRTKELEFFPLSQQEVRDFSKFGELRLSGQLFKEFTNIRDVLA